MPLKNHVFSSLVEDENDALGMIAYSFYKLHKREFCEEFERDTGHEPEREDWDRFAIGITASQLDNYRERALQVVDALIEQTAAEQIANEVNLAKEDYRKKLEVHLQTHNNALTRLEVVSNSLNTISEQTKPPKPRGYWYGVSQGVVASLVFVFLVGLGAFLLKALNIDIFGHARKLGENIGNMETPASSSTPPLVPTESLPRH